ncbi:MAG: DNA gyrase C-terminal beta-propeller domain-containing protein, partial [Pseudomonadota bacterium]
RGIVYKMKVWRLPLAAPQARGKALINLLPLEPGENVTSILPLPEDEDSWDTLDVMFATQSGSVRRNKLSDFVQVNRNGKIAMKLDEGDGIVGVETCTDNDDVLLTSAAGQSIRFPVTDVRVFQSRASTGVRGILLGDTDTVISMSILHHFTASPAERTEYLKRRRLMRGDTEASPDDLAEGVDGPGIELTEQRYVDMSASEQFILTLSENGFGKRSSSFEYRVSGRGGKGIIAMTVNDRNGPLIASFPVEDSDQIMLVTDGGQLIRCPVEQISLSGRSTQGVTVFSTANDEKVVSVERVTEDDEMPDDEADDGEVGEGPAEAE